jgi:hypothetical protein
MAVAEVAGSASHGKNAIWDLVVVIHAQPMTSAPVMIAV